MGIRGVSMSCEQARQGGSNHTVSPTVEVALATRAPLTSAWQSGGVLASNEAAPPCGQW
jgi:hypothetical protein